MLVVLLLQAEPDDFVRPGTAASSMASYQTGALPDTTLLFPFCIHPNFYKHAMHSPYTAAPFHLQMPPSEAPAPQRFTRHWVPANPQGELGDEQNSTHPQINPSMYKMTIEQGIVVAASRCNFSA
jgi:hypothetical protein